MTTDETFRAILAGIYDQAADIRVLDERVRSRMFVSAVLMAYDMARDDPNARLPTYLVAALEQLRRE